MFVVVGWLKLRPKWVLEADAFFAFCVCVLLSSGILYLVVSCLREYFLHCFPISFLPLKETLGERDIRAFHTLAQQRARVWDRSLPLLSFTPFVLVFVRIHYSRMRGRI